MIARAVGSFHQRARTLGTKYDGSERERVALDAFIKLMRSAQSVESDLDEHLQDWGLTTTQFGVVEAIHHLGPMHQKELGEKLLTSGGNITVVVNNLEERDLVARRRRESDRRYVEVRLTDAGRDLIEQLMPRHVERIVGRFSSLTPEEQRRLGKLLRRLGRDDSGRSEG